MAKAIGMYRLIFMTCSFFSYSTLKPCECSPRKTTEARYETPTQPARPLPGRGRACARRPPRTVLEQLTHTVRQRWSWETKDLAGNDPTRRHDCCCPSEHMHVLTLWQSAPVSLRQLAGSKSLLPFLSADVMPGIAFPRSAECYRGSLGPRFPTLPGWAPAHSRGTVRCYDCLRPSRLVRLSLPSGTLV